MDLRHYLLPFVFYFCILSIYAQDWLWAVQAGGPETDNVTSIASDQDGNVYLTGFYSSIGIDFGHLSLTGVEGVDVFLAKYDQDGNPVWARSAGGTGDDVGYSVTIDPTGNIIVSGSFTSDSVVFGSTVLKNKGVFDVFVAKYDALGNLIWARGFGGDDQDDGFGITTDDKANIYVTGHFASSSMVLPGDTVYNSAPGFTEIFIMKFDAGGNYVWTRTATGTNSDSGFYISSGSDDDLYITGFFRSLTIQFGQELLINSAPSRDLFVARYTTDGDVLWAKRAGSDLNDVGYTVQLISGERILLTGSYRSDSIILGNNVLKNTQVGGLDFFITQLDTTGQFISVTGGGGDYDEYGWAARPDNEGSIFMAGGFGSPDILLESGTLTNAGDSTLDSYIIKYHPDGYSLWSESFGGVNDDYITWLAPGPSNSMYVAGYLESPSLTIGKTLLGGNGEGDIFIARLASASLVVEEKKKNDPFLKVYPNPTYNHFTVELNDPHQGGYIELYNSLGQIILTRKISGSEAVSGFSATPGIYFLQVKAGNNLFSETIIIH